MPALARSAVGQTLSPPPGGCGRLAHPVPRSHAVNPNLSPSISGHDRAYPPHLGNSPFDAALRPTGTLNAHQPLNSPLELGRPSSGSLSRSGSPPPVAENHSCGDRTRLPPAYPGSSVRGASKLSPSAAHPSRWGAGIPEPCGAPPPRARWGGGTPSPVGRRHSGRRGAPRVSHRRRACTTTQGPGVQMNKPSHRLHRRAHKIPAQRGFLGT